MTAVLRTDIGRVRKQNEDAAFMNEERGIYVVADGMGGHLAGEVASQMAIDAMKRMAEKHDTASISVLREAVCEAHEAISARARANQNCSASPVKRPKMQFRNFTSSCTSRSTV